MFAQQKTIRDYQDTSASAYHLLRGKLRKRQGEVLRAVQELGGFATSYEVAERLGVPLHTISGRITELKEKEVLLDTGDRKERKNKNGTRSSFIVWRYTHAGE